ncbi:MAG: nucleotidyltransferase domain-containing protein [Ardenticatenales bacterium]|nr:nucleotidyltransferase domain-containing protein [Ardenticatenales bacterium]
MSDDTPTIPLLAIPVGTQVVTRVELPRAPGEAARPSGSVGVVVHAPTDESHSYRVRFPDGEEMAVRRAQLSIRKHFQREGLGADDAPLAEFGLGDYIIYRCVVGSRAYGLNQEASDTDRRGIYLPPAELHWSLYGVPEQLESKETEETYWELQKFILLALKANPNTLECLYSPLVETITPLAQELLDIRTIFLSRLVYQTYNGYVMSQFKKMEQDLRNKGQIKPKHAMHLIRLLLSGITVLRAGFVVVDVGEHRETLLAIRNEELAWEEVNRWRLELHKAFEEAFRATRLPERPDYEQASAFLIRARRSMVS